VKHHVFIDSDIILDVLANREPFYQSAAALFSLLESNKIKGFTSVIVFVNIHYLLRKQVSGEQTRTYLNYLKTLLQILPVDVRTIELALNSSFPDFEDAVQYHCAKQNGLEYFITRNKKDYDQAEIHILNAYEYMAMLQTLASN